MTLEEIQDKAEADGSARTINTEAKRLLWHEGATLTEEDEDDFNEDRHDTVGRLLLALGAYCNAHDMCLENCIQQALTGKADG